MVSAWALIMLAMLNVSSSRGSWYILFLPLSCVGSASESELEFSSLSDFLSPGTTRVICFEGVCTIGGVCTGGVLVRALRPKADRGSMVRDMNLLGVVGDTGDW